MTTIRTIADRIEAGRFKLAAPRVVEGTGGVIYTMALAVPGVHGYPFGSVLTPPDVLADESWLAQLAGVPIIDDDAESHVEGVTPEDIGPKAIGRILRAWWDDEQQAVIGEGVVDVQRGLDAIAAGVTGVSVGYPADLLDEAGVESGQSYTIRQVRRHPASNVAITRSPRHVVTHLQADSTGAHMDPKLLEALRLLFPDQDPAKFGDAGGAEPSLLMELIKMLLGAEQRATMAESKLASGAPPAKAGEGGDEPPPEADAETEEEVEAEVGAFADALRAADAAGVTVDPTWTLAKLQREVLIKRGVRGADSLGTDALGAAIGVLATVKQADAIASFAATGKPAGGSALRPTDDTF